VEFVRQWAQSAERFGSFRDFIRHPNPAGGIAANARRGVGYGSKIAGDLMVQNPTTAELWHNVASACRAMLTNSFSFLPIQDRDGVWKLLSDVVSSVACGMHGRRANVTCQAQLQTAVDTARLL
jgi:hypothetical protein